MSEGHPCPWCGKPIAAAPAPVQARKRTWTSDDDVVREQSLVRETAQCAECGRPVARDGSPDAPWTPVYMAGDRVCGPHPKDATSGHRYSGTVISVREERRDTGELWCMVTVEFDQGDLFTGRETVELLAEALRPAPS